LYGWTGSRSSGGEEVATLQVHPDHHLTTESEEKLGGRPRGKPGWSNRSAGADARRRLELILP
jgi:hypothetical protein